MYQSGEWRVGDRERRTHVSWHALYIANFVNHTALCMCNVRLIA